MQTNLLEFLYGVGPKADLSTAELGEQIVKLFEEADQAENDVMVANKKPLASALKSLGITAEVVTGAQCAEIHTEDDAQYHKYCRVLMDPDVMHKLAEMGWVVVKCGDSAMANEKPDYRIGFIEIQDADTSDDEKPEDAEKIRKQAQKDANTPFKRDDKLNPVELKNPEMGDKQAGVGKAQDGADPEGKPKGSTKKIGESAENVKSVDNLLEAPPAMDEATMAAAVPAFPDAGLPMQRRFNPRKRQKPSPLLANAPKSQPNRQ